MSDRTSHEIIISDTDSESESIEYEESDHKSNEQAITREAKIANLDMTVKIHHLLVARETIEKRGHPILFNVESARCIENNLYAWYPVGNEKQRTIVLDTFYAMMVDREQIDNLRILTDCFIGLLLTGSTMEAAKESARSLLTECFGTYQLGTIKRVIRPYEDAQRNYGDVDFYLVPQRVQTYTLLGR